MLGHIGLPEKPEARWEWMMARISQRQMNALFQIATVIYTGIWLILSLIASFKIACNSNSNLIAKFIILIYKCLSQA